LRSDKGATAATTTAARAVGPTLAKPAGAPVATPSLGGSSSSAGVPVPPLLAGGGLPLRQVAATIGSQQGAGIMRSRQQLEALGQQRNMALSN